MVRSSQAWFDALLIPTFVLFCILIENKHLLDIDYIAGTGKAFCAIYSSQNPLQSRQYLLFPVHTELAQDCTVRKRFNLRAEIQTQGSSLKPQCLPLTSVSEECLEFRVRCVPVTSFLGQLKHTFPKAWHLSWSPLPA